MIHPDALRLIPWTTATYIQPRDRWCWTIGTAPFRNKLVEMPPPEDSVLPYSGIFDIADSLEQLFNICKETINTTDYGASCILSHLLVDAYGPWGWEPGSYHFGNPSHVEWCRRRYLWQFSLPNPFKGDRLRDDIETLRAAARARTKAEEAVNYTP